MLYYDFELRGIPGILQELSKGYGPSEVNVIYVASRATWFSGKVPVAPESEITTDAETTSNPTRMVVDDGRICDQLRPSRMWVDGFWTASVYVIDGAGHLRLRQDRRSWTQDEDDGQLRRSVAELVAEGTQIASENWH